MLGAPGVTCSGWEHTCFSHFAVHRRQEHTSRFKPASITIMPTGTRGRKVDYVALNSSQDMDRSLIGEAPLSTSRVDDDQVEIEVHAAVHDGVNAAEQHHAAASVSGSASALDDSMDDDDLDRRLQAAEEESVRLAALEERARKKQRLSDLERANQERRQRASLQPRVPTRPVTHEGTAAQHHRQLRAGPDVNNGGAVNIADLRRNAEVDRRAGALLRDLNLVSDSDTEPEYAVSDQRRRSTRQGRRVKSGMDAKATDVVVSPQFWPHVCLPLEQVGREFAFGDLDRRLLTAGELEIITGDTVSAVEKEGRLTLLKDVTYIAGSHGWQTAKNVYSAVLRRIELGTLQWDSDFSAIKQVVLLKPTATNNVSKFGAKKPSRGTLSPNAWYCRAFQSRSCTKKAPHDDVLPSGMVVSVEHFCSVCYAKDKKKALHAKTESSCPYHSDWPSCSAPDSNVIVDVDPIHCLSVPDVPSIADVLPHVLSDPLSLPDFSAEYSPPLGESNADRYLFMHDMINQSGRPNFQGCRLPVPSTFNFEFLWHHSQNYTDKGVLDLLKFGFPINSTGSYKVCHPVKNHKGAREFPEAIDKYLRKEISHDAVIGPFSSNPFSLPCKINPLNSVPKRCSEDRRIIVDLSFPLGNSVNSTIPKDSYLGEPTELKFPTVDALIAMIKRKGRGCALFKRDLQRAYRQIPVDPGDVHHLGYSWRDQLYFDVMLPMGLRSAALCCQRTTNLLTYIARNHGIAVENYLDDFMGAEVWEKAGDSFQRLGSVIAASGAHEAPDKACPPACAVTCLGILFNTRDLSLTITPDRLEEITELLRGWAGRVSASRHDLQVLLGKLQFVACCVRPGRIFVSRLLNFLRETPETGRVPIPVQAQKDVAWWLKFMPLYNGVSMIPWEDWCEPDAVVSSDACLEGCGAWVEGQYFHSQFPDFIIVRSLCINSLELLAIVVACKLWGATWRGMRIRVLCDNMTSVQVLNSGASRDEFLQECLREICFLAALHEFEIRAQHIAGVDNRVADLCSRLHLSDHKQMFDKCNALWGLHRQSVTPELFQFSHLW